MAVASNALVVSSGPSGFCGILGLRAGGYGLEVRVATKLVGDTAATIVFSTMRQVFTVAVYNSAGTLVPATAVITGNSVAFTNLGSDTFLTILAKGSRK